MPLAASLSKSLVCHTVTHILQLGWPAYSLSGGFALLFGCISSCETIATPKHTMLGKKERNIFQAEHMSLLHDPFTTDRLHAPESSWAVSSTALPTPANAMRYWCIPAMQVCMPHGERAVHYRSVRRCYFIFKIRAKHEHVIFCCTNHDILAKSRGHPGDKVCCPWLRREGANFRGKNELSDHPFVWKTPTPPGGPYPKS